MSVRPATIAGGENDSTATLMNRYGTPHRSAIAPKSSHPRREKPAFGLTGCADPRTHARA